MFDQMTLDLTFSVTFSPESEFGATHLGAQAGRTINLSGQDLARANLSARQAKALGFLTSGTFGQHGITSLGGGCTPTIFGEQVASKDAEPWIDLVQTDLEALGFQFAAVPFPAASVGAPHIRDRLYWVANNQSEQRSRGTAGRDVSGKWREKSAEIAGLCGIDRLDNNNNKGLEGFGLRHQASIGYGEKSVRSVAAPGESGGMADLPCIGINQGRTSDAEKERDGITGNGGFTSREPAAGPTNGFWADADWLFCRDGKWRPVEPGTFPLANGITNRVGRLRAYGNCIDAPQAEIFIKSFLECEACL